MWTSLSLCEVCASLSLFKPSPPLQPSASTLTPIKGCLVSWEMINSSADWTQLTDINLFPLCLFSRDNSLNGREMLSVLHVSDSDEFVREEEWVWSSLKEAASEDVDVLDETKLFDQTFSHKWRLPVWCNVMIPHFSPRSSASERGTEVLNDLIKPCSELGFSAAVFKFRTLALFS